jgi:hypothetical protein
MIHHHVLRCLLMVTIEDEMAMWGGGEQRGMSPLVETLTQLRWLVRGSLSKIWIESSSNLTLQPEQHSALYI